MSIVRRRRYDNLLPALGGARYLYNNRNAIQSYARRGIQSAMRMRSGFAPTMRKKYTSSGQGVTSQYDRRLIYRKKTMPRRYKRRWKKQIRTVNAITEKSLGSRTVLRNFADQYSLNLSSGNANVQFLQSYALYPMKDTGTAHMNDLATMAGDAQLGPSSKMLFQSGIIDFTVRNSSYTNVAGQTIPSLEIDVYEITAGRSFWTNGSGEGYSLNTVFDQGMTDSTIIVNTTGGTDLVRSQRGWTPWDCPPAISQYKLKIWKKTKFFLSPEQTFTYQYRDPKRHVFDTQNIPNSTSQNQPGMTRFFYFVWKPVTGYTYADPFTTVAQLSVGCTKKYLYKINAVTNDFDLNAS